MGLAMSSDLRPRILSALVMVAAAIVTTVMGGVAFTAFWFIAAFVCFYEWLTVSLGGAFRPIQCLLAVVALAVAANPSLFGWQGGVAFVAILAALVAVSPEDRRFWSISGLLIAAGLLAGMVLLRSSLHLGSVVVFWLFAIVWASDVSAYFSGRAIGGPKLMPSISPKKTWSGFIGGTIGGTLAAMLTLAAFGHALHWQTIVCSACLSIVSAAGDLVESAFKRRFDVKDSSRLIPGHGGVLDRLDGFIAVVIAAVFIGYLRNEDAARGLLVW